MWSKTAMGIVYRDTAQASHSIHKPTQVIDYTKLIKQTPETGGVCYISMESMDVNLLLHFCYVVYVIFQLHIWLGCEGTSMPQHTSGSQRSSYKNGFSPSIL